MTVCWMHQMTGACLHGNRCPNLHAAGDYEGKVVTMLNYGDNLNNDAALKAQMKKLERMIACETGALVKKMAVARNLASHLKGNTYVEFEHSTIAAAAKESLNGAAVPNSEKILTVRTTAMNFIAVCECKAYKAGKLCKKGRFCNDLHLLRSDRIGRRKQNRRMEEEEEDNEQEEEEDNEQEEEEEEEE